MQKLLFVCRSLDFAGGVESSFINLIENIHKNYEIDILAFSISPLYRKKLEGKATLIESGPFLEMLGKTQSSYKKSSVYYWFRAILVLYCRIFSNTLPLKYIIKRVKINKRYDCAISFIQAANKHALSDGNNHLVISNNINANKKIVFIHSDYDRQGLSTSYHYNIYCNFDLICAVSESCKKQIIKCVPSFARKVEVVHNFTDIENVVNLSKAFNPNYNSNKINFATVARLSEEKGLLRMLEICLKLVKVNKNFCWHIVGGGDLKVKIESFIQENKLDCNIKLYGEKENPYPYIKFSDFLLICSYHEAAPMVIGEAKALKVPIVSAETLSSREQIINNVEGVIIPNDDKDILDAMIHIVNNTINIKQIKSEMQKIDFNNNIALEDVKRAFDR